MFNNLGKETKENVVSCWKIYFPIGNYKYMCSNNPLHGFHWPNWVVFFLKSLYTFRHTSPKSMQSDNNNYFKYFIDDFFRF